MTNGKRFKVLAIMPKLDGTGEYMTRIGSAFENKDGSLNAYLDLVPTITGKGGMKIQIRELDERDLQKREAYAARGTLGASTASASSSTYTSASNDAVPF